MNKSLTSAGKAAMGVCLATLIFAGPVAGSDQPQTMNKPRSEARKPLTLTSTTTAKTVQWDASVWIKAAMPLGFLPLPLPLPVVLTPVYIANPLVERLATQIHQYVAGSLTRNHTSASPASDPNHQGSGRR